MQQKQDVFFNDIKSFSSEFSFLSKFKNSTAEHPIMSGRFNYQSFTDGLNFHASDATETQDTAISSEVEPSVSFSFLFNGSIDFSLGNKSHKMAIPANASAVTCIVINNKKDLFTRYLMKGMHIKKLTISVSKLWLESRCQTENDFNIVDSIFNKTGIYDWQPTISAIEKAKSLIDASNATSLTGKLNTEHLTMELLAICLDTACKIISQSTGKQRTTTEAANTALLKQIDSILDSVNTVPEIAQQLNISVSTLQRNFKRSYGINISDYIKERRLEQAKKALVLNELSIGEVAYQVGYKHSSNFINAFKNKFGMTPAAYVRLHKRH